MSIRMSVSVNMIARIYPYQHGEGVFMIPLAPQPFVSSDTKETF